MKTMRLTIVAVLTAMCSSTFAQVESGWNSVYAQFRPMSFVPKKGDSYSFKGVTLGYNRAVNIVSNVPLYVEIGAAVQYSFYSKETQIPLSQEMKSILSFTDEKTLDSKSKISLLSVKVPVSVSYKHQIPNSNMAIAPYVGLILRGNVLGKGKRDDKYDEETKIDLIE